MGWRRKVSAILAAVLTVNSAAVFQVSQVYAASPEDADKTQEQAQEETQERSVLFNEGWRFKVWPNAGANKKTYSENDANVASKDYDDSSWRKLDLPHDWSIEEDFTSEISVEQGALPTGIGWYRKSTVLPASDEGKRINLDFGGVFANCTIYVNGSKVGDYYYGYNAFSFDITDYVVCDGQTENVIAVKVNSPKKGSRWYTGSGIYRNVYLTVTDATHVSHYGTAVYTPDLEKEYASGKVTTKIQTSVENEGTQETKIQVRNTLLNYETGTEFSGALPVTSEEITLAAGEKKEITQDMQTVDPKLWSVDDPNLYTMRTEIISNGKVIDSYDTRFGYKWCTFDGNEGFSLNGEWMKLQGVCMHHDQGSLGSAAYEAAIYRQMKTMKEMGANAIRVTHNPADEALIRACDELGLMVVEEGFDGWWSAKDSSGYASKFRSVCTHPDAEDGITWGAYDFRQMILKDRNSPSIIMWSVGNEVYESGDTAVEWLRQAAQEIAPKADPAGHLVTMGDNQFKRITSFNAEGSRAKMSDQVDVVGLNYSEEQYDKFHSNWKPDWILYGSETASATSSRGWYSNPDKTTGAATIKEYNLSSYDNCSVSWGRTATNSLIPDRDRKYIAGQFVWTGFDYIGEPSPFGSKGGSSTSGPKSSFFGIVDTAGFAKDSYYLYQSQWTDVETNPMVHILPHWNWEDASLRELVTVNGKIPVRVYSNAASVELFVDGKSQGKKAFTKKTTDYGLEYQQQSETSDRLYLEWPLTWNYKVGTTIEAVAYDENGKEIARDQVTTAGDAAELQAEADRSVISADGKDLSYITVDVADKDGNFVPTADNEIYFNISGDGEIVGVDNGDAASWERYKDYDGVWKRKAYSGKALVIVKSTKENGSFTLTASSSGLAQDSVTVYTTEGEVQDDTILGYDTVTVTADQGTAASDIVLPTTVSAIRADGTKTEENVTWEEITEDLSKIKEYEIKGTTESGANVTALLNIRGKVGVKSVSVGVKKGEVPQMPETVEVVWSDGKTESRKVTWDAVSADQTAQGGTIAVKGRVEGENFEATAYVVVLEQAVKENVALASNGASVSVSYQEGSHKPSYLIDGIIDSDSNGWGNWQKGGRFEDWADITFAKENTVSEAVVRMNDTKTYQLPDRILISYWDEESQSYKEVTNQSKTSGFVNNREANTITFDPVTTTKLRFTFYVDGGAYASGKDMLKINEIEVYAEVFQLNRTAALESLKINGKEAEDFAADKYQYSYSVGYAEEVPTVEATAADGANVFIRQATSANGQAVVEVTSQDGTTVQEYMVQFNRKDPVLTGVEFKDLADQVTEDDVVALQVVGKTEDGKEISSANAEVQYELTDGTDGGHAEIRDGKFYAYQSGTVKIRAKMTYKGVTCETEEKTITIASATEAKEFDSFEEVKLRVNKGTVPVLPEEITVYYKNALSRKYKVTWDSVDAEKYQKPGKVEVKGTIEGMTQQPVAVITVVDIVAAQNLSMAAAEGYDITLPAETTVYYSDGQKEKAEIVWDTKADSTTEGICKGHIKDTEVSVTCTVRRTGEGTDSENYVIKYNGWGLPDGLASFTNDTTVNAKAADNATYVNDGFSDFSNGSDKKIWCNYVPSTVDPSKTQRKEDWVAATIAVSGEIVEKAINKVRFGVIDEESTSTKTTKVPKAYHVEYYVGPDYSDMLMERYTTAGIQYGGQMANETLWPNNPLNDSANWKEVEYIDKAAIPTGKNGDWKQMLNVTFKPVKTSLVRLRLEAYDDYCVGVNELEAYGTVAKAQDTIEGADIQIGGKSVMESFENQKLTWKIGSKEELPEVTASADNNAAVTVVQANELNPAATVIFVPEDGNEVNIKTYQITFEREATKPEDPGIAERAEAAAKAAQEAADVASAAAKTAESTKAEAVKAAEEAKAAKEEAEAAKAAAKAAQEAAEKAKQDAKTAKTAADADKAAAEAAAQRAESAEAAAKAAQEKAETAQTKAEAAKTAAQMAQANAETAENNAKTAQGKAETAADAAKDAKEAAELAKTDAETAKTKAEEAQQKAETARDAAVNAKEAAEEAKGKAEAATAEAKEAKEAAEAAGTAAKAQADLAKAYADAAQASAEKALAAAKEAADAAKRAEEAYKKAEEKLAQVQKEAEEKLAKMEELLKAERFQNQKAKIKKVNAGKGKLQVSWKAAEGADGYVIEYAQKANFKGKKQVVVKNGSKTSQKISKLKKKKTYYVRIKAYRENGTEKVYTRFSAKKKVRTK